MTDFYILPLLNLTYFLKVCLFYFMWMLLPACMYVHDMCAWCLPLEVRRGSWDPLVLELQMDACEPLCVGAGNQTQVLCKSNKHSEPPSQLSSPKFLIFFSWHTIGTWFCYTVWCFDLYMHWIMDKSRTLACSSPLTPIMSLLVSRLKIRLETYSAPC